MYPGRSLIERGSLEEIASRAAAEPFCFADINHPPGRILHEVQARLLGKLANLGSRPAEREEMRLTLGSFRGGGFHLFGILGIWIEQVITQLRLFALIEQFVVAELRC